MTAASQLYSLYGLQWPLADIANAAQTSIAMIYKYYGSQEGLAIAFLQHCEKSIQGEWEEPEEEFPNDPRNQIRSWIESKEIIATDADWSCFDLLRAAAFLLPYRGSRALAYIRKLKLQERNELAKRCKAAGFSDPKGLADKLMLIVEGAMAGNLIHGLNGPSIELPKAAEAMMAGHQPLKSAA